MDRVDVTEQQFIDAMNAFNTSAFNGIVGLAAVLRGAGILKDAGLQSLYDSLSAPLAPNGLAENPAVQMMQEKIDVWFAAILSVRPSASPDGEIP